jgi:hypothetical protein
MHRASKRSILENVLYLLQNSEVIMRDERGYIFPNRIRALAGFIKCRYCDGEVVQVSAKNRGCYGCCNAKKESCDNTLLISVRGVKTILLNDLKEKFLTVESLKYIDESAMNNLLGKIGLEPVPGKCWFVHTQPIEISSYYVAHTSIQTVALLDEDYRPEF